VTPRLLRKLFSLAIYLAGFTGTFTVPISYSFCVLGTPSISAFGIDVLNVARGIVFALGAFFEP